MNDEAKKHLLVLTTREHALRILNNVIWDMEGNNFSHDRNYDRIVRNKRSLAQSIEYHVTGHMYYHEPIAPHIRNLLAAVHAYVQEEIQLKYKGLTVTSFCSEMTKADVVILMRNAIRRMEPSKEEPTVIGRKEKKR